MTDSFSTESAEDLKEWVTLLEEYLGKGTIVCSVNFYIHVFIIHCIIVCLSLPPALSLPAFQS